MTWLGKILAVLVLLVSVTWAAITAQAYVTRTNWKTRAETYKKAFDQAAERLQYERQERISATADLETRNRAYAQEIATQGRHIDSQSAGASELIVKNQNLTNVLKTPDEQVRQAQANAEVAAKREADLRKEKAALDRDLDKARFDLEAADRERRTAIAKALLEQDRAEDKTKRLEVAMEELRQARAELQRSPGNLKSFDPNEKAVEPPVPGTRATVLAYGDGQVVFSLGLDAGIRPGAELRVERRGGGGQYLGTLKVGDIVEEKRSVATFIPASGKSLRDLKPNEVPQKGDLVQPMQQ